MNGERSGMKQGVWAGAALLLLLLPALACAPVDPPPAAEVIDLLALSPPETPSADGLSPADRLVWNFNGGLPAGWCAGPEGVSVLAEDDGVRLEHPDDLPWLELRCGSGNGGDPRLPAGGIDPLHYGRFNASLHSLGAAKAALYYSFAEPARFERHLRSRVKYRTDSGSSVYGFELPGADGFETPIRVIRLYPALTGGSAVVRRMALVPRNPEYITGHVLSRGWVSLGQQYRRCWRLAGPGIREVSFRLPAGPTDLRFAVGRLTGEKPSRLTVELEERTGSVHRLAGIDAGRPGNGWTGYEANLGQWAGEQVTLRFRAAGDDPGAVTLIGSPAVVPVGGGESAGGQPNVLLILVDTLRADRLSLYGCGVSTSPHLDRLARQGVTFTSGFAPSSWTLPSVAALLTGRYPGELQVGTGQGATLIRGIPTLAEGFSQAGYDTAGFSANCILNPFQGYARGFDTFYLAPFKDYTMPAGRLNRRAEAWFAARGERPFFCYLQYMDPHSPYAPPGSDRRAPSNAGSFHPHRVGGYREADIHPLVMGHETLASTAHVEAVVRAYDDEVRYVDFQIGRLLAGLDRQGLLERTVVVVLADHGEELYDRGFWSHGYTLYQEQLHVPMIFRFPPNLPERPERPAGGQRIHTPVSLVDVLPTLFQMAGIEPAGMPTVGRNLFQAPEDRGLLSETWAGGVPPRFCLRQGPYKYVIFKRDADGGEMPRRYPGQWIWESGPMEEELYHLGNDPGERCNLVAEQPGVAARMREEMERRFGKAAIRSAGGPAGGGKAEKMDQDTEERLRALGYIE